MTRGVSRRRHWPSTRSAPEGERFHALRFPPVSVPGLPSRAANTPSGRSRISGKGRRSESATADNKRGCRGDCFMGCTLRGIAPQERLNDVSGWKNKERKGSGMEQTALKEKAAKGRRGGALRHTAEGRGGNLVKNKASAIKTIEIVKNFPHKRRKAL